MSAWLRMRKRLPISGLAAGALALSLVIVNMALPVSGVKAAPVKSFCTVRPLLCTETTEPWNYQGQYTGHDEPSMEFYSSEQGSGNNSVYLLRLPKDPPAPPQQNGTGGTANFQLHPAFWFGMIMCDNQSAPNPGPNCVPDSDQNIFDSTNPSSPRYIGNTPGQGFMEMQFYPPGWNTGSWLTGVSCAPDSTQWCAALNIDSYSQNSNTGVLNNAACLGAAGQEYVNYAIITKSGNSQAPADPLRQTLASFTTGPDTLEMNSGDVLRVGLHDTAAGFQVVIHDMTTGQVGSMTASIANGFGHPLFQPSSATCTDQPYAFHPMFGTSSPKTRVYWAAHSYNIAYSDEIGHAEYCNAADPTTGACTSAGVTDPGGLDSDDQGCSTGLLEINGQSFTQCLGTDNDFDGPEYGHNWPGSDSNPVADAYLHAQPVAFSSPLFADPSSTGLHNYQQAAFETDLPRIEGSDSSPNNSCERHIVNPSDPNPGVNCVIPPIGASFYPFYSTASTSGGACVWEEGDKYLPNAINRFGGTAAAEYGSLLDLTYPDPGFTTGQIYEDFHRTLPNNPCPAPGG